jgi:hypothetical protein
VSGETWLDLAVKGTHVVGAFAWVGMFGLLAWLSWTMYRSDDVRLKERMQVLRARLIVPLWAVTALVVGTGIYNQINAVPFKLPHPWALGHVDIPYAKSYALLLLGKQGLVATAIAGLAVQTWRLTTIARHIKIERHSDLGSALTSMTTLILAVLILFTAATLGYVHVLSHGH